MPYVPSEKTSPPADDRKTLDPAIEAVAQEAAETITNNLSLIRVYKNIFLSVARLLRGLLIDGHLSTAPDAEVKLAQAIYEVGKKYGYEGAQLGELNYSITRFIQRVPQILVEMGRWKESDELRYWSDASMTEALICAADVTKEWGLGIGGVFEDIKDEHKERVNKAYEIAQILKSGDCYDTPYYSRIVEVVDEDGNLIGHLYVALKRGESTLNVDLLPYQFVLRKKPLA
ncbi:MAG: hypothetical protein HYW89_02245 [Candidatus Sungiibacteriota bacterium]|uniref:Uncharacterized protein n=1 Tax=Candidatus Sungiibacteriota bacterium TaxID=2750080 RepID=A0A7T5RK99_9BACT|nr:MAG: hypothetical protein HYW89_02245 [Candidatus Sungbacteria bacterium]